MHSSKLVRLLEVREGSNLASGVAVERGRAISSEYSKVSVQWDSQALAASAAVLEFSLWKSSSFVISLGFHRANTYLNNYKYKDNVLRRYLKP